MLTIVVVNPDGGQQGNCGDHKGDLRREEEMRWPNEQAVSIVENKGASLSATALSPRGTITFVIPRVSPVCIL
jgi:hypothetical protein